MATPPRRLYDGPWPHHRAALDSPRRRAPAPPSTRLAADVLAAWDAGGKLLVCGNGGSAADSQHLAAELVGRYERERPGWPALALTTDTSALTAISNDFGFERSSPARSRPSGDPATCCW